MPVASSCDGAYDLLAIADMINAPLWELSDTVQRLKRQRLLVAVDDPCP
jgi:hypothetical protein